MNTLNNTAYRRAENLTFRDRDAKSTLFFRYLMSLLILVAWTLASGATAAAESHASSPSDEAVIQAFADAHDGYSSDELLANTELQTAFFRSLENQGVSLASDDERRDALLRVLAIRKAGKLPTRATRTAPAIDAELAPIAEVAARVITDRHRVTIDTMLADPRLKAEFVLEAAKLAPDPDRYSLSKSVLRLRKTRRLQPELVLRVADWDRTIETYSLDQLRGELQADTISHGPGVYLFRNTQGYLYIGEAIDLAALLNQHLTHSDRAFLAEYLEADEASDVSVELHLFPKDSPAAKLTVRRAYESELIRSRNPAFNIRP